MTDTGRTEAAPDAAGPLPAVGASAVMPRSGATFVRVVVGITITVLALFLVEQLLVAPIHVTSGSMRPAIWPGDRLLVTRRIDVHHLDRGAIVVFRAWPPGSNHSRGSFPRAHSRHSDLLVKRVIALPGEQVQARGGVIGIDNRRILDEPWLQQPDRSSSFDAVQLHRNEVWVQGDDRAHSRDSRTFGAVPQSAMVGTVSVRFWPPRRWGRP